jgi:hypothetical protein
LNSAVFSMDILPLLDELRMIARNGLPYAHDHLHE